MTMKHVDYRKTLVGLVDGFLSGRLSFGDFARQYVDCFVEDVPDNYFEKDEFSLFAEIHEKAEWTTEDPPPEDRKYGWTDVSEFTEWLRKQRTKLGRP